MTGDASLLPGHERLEIVSICPSGSRRKPSLTRSAGEGKRRQPRHPCLPKNHQIVKELAICPLPHSACGGLSCHLSSKKSASAIFPGQTLFGGVVKSTTAQSGSIGTC